MDLTKRAYMLECARANMIASKYSEKWGQPVEFGGMMQFSLDDI